MQEDDLHKFRKGFCEKAAELGITPSELLSLNTSKQASVYDAVKGILGFGAKTIPWYTGLILLGGGATLGGLAAAAVNKTRKVVDPEDDLFGDDEDPIRDAKKIQLIAKYRNAINQAKGL